MLSTGPFDRRATPVIGTAALPVKLPCAALPPPRASR
jgi:hypothetical protein